MKLVAFTVARAVHALTMADEAMVRDLLGHWVSGVEPVIARRARDGALLGLTPADALDGVVPFIPTPAMIGRDI